MNKSALLSHMLKGSGKHLLLPAKAPPHPQEQNKEVWGQLQRAAWNKLFPYLLFPQPAINTYYSSLSQGATKQGKLGQRGLPKSYFPFKFFYTKA